MSGEQRGDTDGEGHPAESEWRRENANSKIRKAGTAPHGGHFILGNKFEFYVNETGRPEGF